MFFDEQGNTGREKVLFLRLYLLQSLLSFLDGNEKESAEMFKKVISQARAVRKFPPQRRGKCI